MLQDQIVGMVKDLSNQLIKRKASIATVESCTGGSVAALFTEFSGSSGWYDRGFVTYSNQSKVEMVGVSAQILEQFGAVSEQVAFAMAEGGIRYSAAEFSLSITGIAGPDGGTTEKPVGLVCMGWAGWRKGRTMTRSLQFKGDRSSVRTQSVVYAIKTACELFKEKY